MSRYDWPRQRRRAERDDAAGRGRFMTPRRRELDLRYPVAGAARRRVAFGPADSRTNLWIPLGPSTVVQGQAEGEPRVSGRVRSLFVHPDGQRVYAATANGGVWYSSDGAETWRSLGGFAPTGTDEIVRPAHRHVCGAILVLLDPAAPDDASQDTVFVGTGELIPGQDARPGSKLGGVGVLVSKGPATSIEVDPWFEEAPALLEKAVYRLAAKLDGSTVVAATTMGLLERPAGAGTGTQGVDWPRVAGEPFDDLDAVVTDVLWTPAVPGGAPERLWAWVRGEQAGLWVRDDGEVNFRKVATPGALALRGSLAAADPAAKVYLFNDQGGTTPPALFRVTSGAGLPAAVQVAGVPDMVGTQGGYDLAIAVDPNNEDLVVLGGSFTKSRPGRPTVPRVRGQNANVSGQDYEEDAAIFEAEVGIKAAVLTYGHTTIPRRIGVGCHADVHDLKFSDTGALLWAGCDGGVFRSIYPDQHSAFVARNDGLGVIQANYVASHPTCEGRVVLGLQDNGVVERSSSGVWLHTGNGDGGGVAFDPTDTTRYVRQYFDGQWTSSDPAGTFERLLAFRPVGAPYAQHADAVKEEGAAAFYSTVAAIAHHRGGAAAPTHTQVIIGTTRVWYTEDWAATWVTLPTASDPIGTTTFDKSQDQFGEPITVCKWATSDVAWILGDRKLMRLVRTKDSDVANAPGTWDDDVVLNLHRKASKSSTEGPDALRKVVVWTDVEPNLDAPGVQRGPKGAAYLGTVGQPDDDEVDTLWWFDGDETWHPTSLRDEVAAPVTAVRCDPNHPNDVYVGTTVGVWHGERDIDTLTWDWTRLLNGLPEAAVEDLSLFDDGDLRLLRAAIASRGVWELRLGAPAEDVTYLRAHDDDLRYRLVAQTKQRDGTTERSWHGSPDIRPRPAPVDMPGLAGVVLTKASPGDEVRLRRFQAALRSQSGDDRVRATGKWDLYFEDVLRDLGAPIDPGSGRPIIDESYWNSVMAAPHATREPWATVGQPDRQPTEADLLDLTPPLAEGDLGRVSLVLPATPHKVDVVVHHRGLVPRLGADVRVTLLRWTRRPQDPIPRRADPATWFTGPITWAAAVDDVLNSAGGTTSQSPGDGWQFVGTNAATRRKVLSIDLDSARSAVATFDLDLSPFRNQTVMLLAAVIRAGANSAVATLPLRGLVMSDPHVAVRSLVVER